MENFISSYNKGPNQILPAEDRHTTKRDGRTTIEINSSGIAASKPISVPSLLTETVIKHSQRIALSTLDKNGEPISWTYKEYYQEVRLVAKAFIELGLERYHTVCILGHNTPYWVMSYMGAIFAGGIANGMYLTNSPEACFYCADHSKAQIIVVQDEVQLNKIQQIKHRLPLLKSIVLIEGEPSGNNIISWLKLLRIGQSKSEDELEKRLASIAINECCSIIYTSGTVGNPKGVMMSHDNLIHSVRCFLDQTNSYHDHGVIVSYLPMSHIAGQAFDMIYSLFLGGSVYFADKNALKGTLVQNFIRIQPTHVLGVPRVYEKIKEGFQQCEQKSSSIKRALLSCAKYHTLQHNWDKINGTPTNTWRYWLASILVMKKIRAALGLTRTEYFFAGAAPMSSETRKFFLSLDMPIFDIYGLSETVVHSAVAFNPSGYNIESNGIPLKGNLTRIDNPDADGNGEILCKSRSVFMGYLEEPGKTSEAITEDGYFRSGDIGKFDERGYLIVTGRLKELIITAGGENIPPIIIEDNIKAELPIISNAMVIGDKQKYLTVLLTLKTEVNSETSLPLDKLMPVTQAFMDSLNLSNLTTVTDVLNSGPDPKIKAAIQKGLDEVNKKATSNAQRIQKFVILPMDFSIPTGELGPTLKLKRHFVNKKYESTINNLYNV